MPTSRQPGHRGPGRPLSGSEPLDCRLTVLITSSMERRLVARAGGEDRKAKYVREVLSRALMRGKAVRKVGKKRKAKAARRRRHR